MKTNLNKSTKRALSLVLAFAMLIGSLFTANIGVNISADAATLNIKYWSGETTAPTANSDGSYTINTPEELAYIVNNGYKYDLYTNFKVADGIDAFIMQPSSIIVDSDNNGVLDIMECDSYTETQTFFNNLTGKIPWVAGDSSSAFRSNFDGNGIEIYGLYSASNECAALFPYVGGAFVEEVTEEDWSKGITIKNLAVRNSYLSGTRAAAIIAYEYDKNNSRTSTVMQEKAYKGRVTVQKCEISNCYIVATSNAGVMIGQYAYNNTAYGHHILDCLVYGNYAATDTTMAGLWGSLTNFVSSTNDYAAHFNAGYYKYSNIVSLGTAPGEMGSAGHNVSDPANYSNVYTDIVQKDTWATAKTYSASQVTILGSADAVKGADGKAILDLNWANGTETDTDTTVYWYARANDYPTLFPESDWADIKATAIWDGTADSNFGYDTDSEYAAGTAENPYLIETAEQLYAMVCSTGKDSEGNQLYYKVKERGTTLYLNPVIGGNLATVKSLASGSNYNNWLANSVFLGNFDGNGVTIKGMISIGDTATEYVGLFYSFGEGTIVKNIYFDSCYVKHTARYYAATLASNLIAYNDEDSDGTADGGVKDGYTLISNVAVCKSYIYSSYGGSSYSGGIISSAHLTDMLEMVNCFFDGYSCELGKDVVQDYTGWNEDYDAGIVSMNGVNNLQISGCVSLGQPITPQPIPHLYVENDSLKLNSNGLEWVRGFLTTYNDYSTGTYCTVNSGSTYDHPVYLYNCYTDTKDYQGGVTEADARAALLEAYNAGSKEVPESIIGNTTVINLIDENGASVITADYDYINNMPLLDWANGWEIVEVSDDLDKFTDSDTYKIPMPRVRTAQDVAAINDSDTGYAVMSYNMWVGTADGGAGSSPYNGRNGHFENLVGSGTEADPYIITTDLELARVIGAGGTKLNNKLYFKLANDIDLSGMPWLNTLGYIATSGNLKFKYVPFEGVLDGDGHTITGLYAVNGNTDEASYGTYSNAAGLIPVLASGGVVKNLHIRNSYAASGTGYAGALVGEAQAGSTVSGCSVENTIVVNTSDNGLVGTKNDGASIKNSYISETYYNADGAEVTADAITVDYGTDAENPVWYKGGLESSMPQLVNRAAAMSETDVSGLGDTDYNSADLSALRNKLLRKSAYQYIYGDVNRDGSINSTDLVILRRAMVDDYKDLQDGFWRNVEKNQMIVYYEENDTQDMARKLELYLESEVPGVDILKYALKGGITDDSVTNTLESRPTQNAIIVLKDTPTDDGYDDYSVTYDSTNNVLTVNGGSFTAVEQAVIEFMQKADRATNNVGECTGSILDEKLVDHQITLAEDSDELLVATDTAAEAVADPESYSYKQRVKIGDTYYYYAWGDEFNGVSDTISSDNWEINSYRGEDAGKTYLNQENANLEDLKTLWVCQDGRLSIWRGVNTAVNSDSSTWGWGYKGIDLGTGTTNDFGKEIDANDVYIDPGVITTKNSMLFKQGYVEMEASLPSDGHAFPAWWFLTYSGAKNNTTISNSLYGKVLKYNNVGTNKWDETTTGNYTPGVLSTYKYQVPTAHLEFDIVEPMQTVYNGTETSAYKHTDDQYNLIKVQGDLFNHYKNDFNFTVHKIYDEHAANDTLSIIKWDETTGGSLVSSTALADFNTTSSGSFIHRYDNTKYGGYQVGGKYINDDYNGAYLLGRKMTGTVKYGFAWYADASSGEYGIDIYVDGVNVMTLNQDNARHYANSATIADYLFDQGSKVDAETWNQYAYMLLDNCFYTANQGNGTQYDDLLSQETVGGKNLSDIYNWDNFSYVNTENYQVNDKTTFEINYIRVYQEDGKRDIVTNDTEAFNNGNHFGYGE